MHKYWMQTGEKKKNGLTTGKRSRSKRMLARSFVRFETCLSTSKLNDYTKAWHKLNFHMNCNLSIVVIERNSQYLFLASFSLPLPPSLSSLACFTFVFIHILMHFLSVRYSSMNSQIANSTNKSTQRGCTTIITKEWEREFFLYTHRAYTKIKTSTLNENENVNKFIANQFTPFNSRHKIACIIFNNIYIFRWKKSAFKLLATSFMSTHFTFYE